MSHKSPKKNELSDFVLGYCQQAGAIVDPPAYGVYEVLLPEKAASQLGAATFQRFAFSENSAQEPSEEITYLHYGHPFVERIVEALQGQTANAQLFINTVRLDKRGLFGLARESLSIANARLFEVPTAVEARTLYHYVRFNFKASLITDEKRELILPIWMHLQGGYAVDGEEIVQRASLEPKSNIKNLKWAAPVWRPASGKTSKVSKTSEVWNKSVLSALLERAKGAALAQLSAGPLETLQRKANRFLELDRARLEEYFADLQSDLEKRLQRASDERRVPLETKLALVAGERRAKFDDIEGKYRLRVELELLNLLIVAQPKMTLSVAIKNRSASVAQRVVWDPLLHQMEPLVCDVCGEAAHNLWLCEGGHLAQADCLTPRCVDCKRIYCQLCSDQMKTCVVCERPVCVSSLNRCSTCGRATCREHVELCHADNGKPASIQAAAAPKPEPALVQTVESPAPIPEKTAEKLPPKPPPKSSASGASKKTGSTPKKAGPKSRQTVKKPKRLKAKLIEVYSEMNSPQISAYVLTGRWEIAVRYWELAEDGIRVSCHCEKPLCRENGMLLRPETADRIESQIWEEIRALREEYGLQPKGVRVYRVIRDQPKQERRLMLFGRWKNAEFLARAQAAYDKVE